MPRPKPVQLCSRQWSCSELAAGMAHLVRCKEESDEALKGQLQETPFK